MSIVFRGPLKTADEVRGTIAYGTFQALWWNARMTEQERAVLVRQIGDLSGDPSGDPRITDAASQFSEDYKCKHDGEIKLVARVGSNEQKCAKCGAWFTPP